MSTQDLSPDQLAAAEKIIKLLNLAAKAGTPAEAAAATTKAQELLEKYNLDSSVLDTLSGAKDGRREENLVDGGFYAFHRDLWRQVAELNFCVYWNQKYISDEVWKGKRVTKRRHALVGRIVNTRMTVAMATYLQGAVERLVNEQISPNERLSNWAHNFRKGAIKTICDKLYDRRLEVLETERKAAREAALKAGEGGETYSTGRGLTLADFIHGEGYSAKKAAERAERADRVRRMEQAYTAWAKENPKEARSKFRFKDEKTGQTWHYGTDRRGWGGGPGSRGGGPGSRGGSDGIDHGAFRAGREAGESIGLDPQAEAAKAAGLLK